MEVASMWVSIAAVIIMIGWFRSKSEEQRHQTFRTIVEKTGMVDEAQLRLLFDTRTTSPGRHSRLRVRVLGAIAMFLAMCSLILGGWVSILLFGDDPFVGTGLVAGITWTALVCLLGIGLFFWSGLAERSPPDIGSRRTGEE